MTAAAQKVYDVCKQYSKLKLHQITIDMVEDEVMSLFEWTDKSNIHEEVGAQVNRVTKLLAVFDKKHTIECAYLANLRDWLNVWLLELENTHRIIRAFNP